jgi:hypothetical protein
MHCVRCGSDRLRVDSTVRHVRLVPTLSIPIVFIGCAECGEHLIEVDLPDLIAVLDPFVVMEGVRAAAHLDHRLVS